MMANEVPKKVKNKTKLLLLSQTPEQNQVSSQEIERWMSTELKTSLRFYLSQYGPKLENRLGLTKDDLLNDARFQIWKGLVTFKANGKAGMKTYLTRLLDNRFRLLLKKTQTRKESSLTYYANVWEQTNVSPEHNETGETIFESRNAVMGDLNSLAPEDVPIYEQLLLGSSIGEMEKVLNTKGNKTKYTRIQIIGAINRITLLIEQRQE